MPLILMGYYNYVFLLVSLFPVILRTVAHGRRPIAESAYQTDPTFSNWAISHFRGHHGDVIPEVMTRPSETAALHASAKNIRGVTITVQLGTCCWLRQPDVIHSASRGRHSHTHHILAASAVTLFSYMFLYYIYTIYELQIAPQCIILRSNC